MNRTIQLLNGAAALLGLLGACCFTGCAPVDPADEDGQVGEAQQAQVDPNVKVWSRVTMTLADPASTPFATVYVFNRALGAYQTGTEYWFVNLNSTSLLGRYALNMVQTDQTTTSPPPDPAYASEQSFSLPEFVSWGTGWTTDPGSGGSLYSGPSQHSLRLTTGSSGLSNIRWYQVIASTATPHNLTVNGLFTVGATSVSVPSGYLGYSISQTP
jgi:hypothetical protein